ncbi:MAG TPA: hypothetical protein VFQ53_22535 [Kofleriaceae bacterium]|nr:hypothetical protein [Kofleriaceae bacterium]
MASPIAPKLSGLALVQTLGSSALKHAGPIRAVRVTPDGRRILTLGDGKCVHVWDAETGEHVTDLAGTDQGLYALAVSPDGRRVFAGGHEAQVFEVATRKRLHSLRVHSPLVVAAAFGPDNSILVGDDRTVRRFDPYGLELPALVPHASRIEAIAVSRDGKLAITCGGDRKVKIQSVAGPRPEVIASWPGSAKSCGFSPDGSLAWSAGFDHAIVRGSASGRITFSADRLDRVRMPELRIAAMSPDGSRFAVGFEHEVVVCALPGGKIVARLAVSAVQSLAFTPDDQRLVVGSATEGIGVYELASERRVLPPGPGHALAIEDLVATPNVLYSLGADGLVVLWDLETGTAVERLGSVTGSGVAIACSEGRLATASNAGELLVWDVRGPDSRSLAVEGQASAAVAFSRTGALLAFAPDHGQAQVFDLVAATRTTLPKLQGGQLRAVTFVGEDVVVAGSTDGTIVAARYPDGHRVWTATCTGFVSALALVGDVLAGGTTEGQLAVFDANRGTPIARLRPGGPEILRMCPVDDEHFALLRRAADFESAVVELWSVVQRRVVGSADLTPLYDRARSLRASPDGTRLYVGTTGSRILVFARA